MLIYKINLSLLTLFSLFIYIFGGRGLKGRAGCRRTELQTNKQTNRQTISRGYAKELANRRSIGPTPRIGEHWTDSQIEKLIDCFVNANVYGERRLQQAIRRRYVSLCVIVIANAVDSCGLTIDYRRPRDSDFYGCVCLRVSYSTWWFMNIY